MKKFLLLLLIPAGAASFCAAEAVLIYNDAASLKAGKSALAARTKEGVLTSASLALASQGEPLLGFMSGELHKGRLIRLDKELDVALIKVGEPITALDLNDFHRKRAAAIKGFLPEETETEQRTEAPSFDVSEPFGIKINGADIAEEPVVLAESRREAEATLEVVYLSTSSAWNIRMTVVADPPHLFWRKGETKTLTRVPSHPFEFSQQLLFKPMKQGDVTKLKLELSAIKSPDTEWTVLVRTKQMEWRKKVRIKFE